MSEAITDIIARLYDNNVINSSQHDRNMIAERQNERNKLFKQSAENYKRTLHNEIETIAKAE